MPLNQPPAEASYTLVQHCNLPWKIKRYFFVHSQSFLKFSFLFLGGCVRSFSHSCLEPVLKVGVAFYRAAIRVNGFSVLSPDQIKRMVVSAVTELLFKWQAMTVALRHNMILCNHSVATHLHFRLIQSLLLHTYVGGRSRADAVSARAGSYTGETTFLESQL